VHWALSSDAFSTATSDQSTGMGFIEYKDADRIRIDYRRSCMLDRFIRARADADGALGRKLMKSSTRKSWRYIWIFPHSGDGHFCAY
jgi:hypothetical protein